MCERYPAARRDVIALPRRAFGTGRRREQVRLNDVADVAEIARRLPVAVDGDRYAGEHRCRPPWNHRRVRALGILSRTEHVEVSQSHARGSIAAIEDLGVELVEVLGDRIRRERQPDFIFDFWESGMVAVRRARSGLDKSLYAGIARGDQNVQKSCPIGGMRGE